MDHLAMATAFIGMVICGEDCHVLRRSLAFEVEGQRKKE